MDKRDTQWRSSFSQVLQAVVASEVTEESPKSSLCSGAAALEVAAAATDTNDVVVIDDSIVSSSSVATILDGKDEDQKDRKFLSLLSVSATTSKRSTRTTSIPSIDSSIGLGISSTKDALNRFQCLSILIFCVVVAGNRFLGSMVLAMVGTSSSSSLLPLSQCC
jgi:hypothetical protein